MIRAWDSGLVSEADDAFPLGRPQATRSPVRATRRELDNHPPGLIYTAKVFPA
jgi:hypothetical protein